MGTHSQPFTQNQLMDVYEIGRNEVLMVMHMRLGFLARFAHGYIQGRAKIGQCYEGPLLQRTSSLEWNATASNRMYSSDLKA